MSLSIAVDELLTILWASSESNSGSGKGIFNFLQPVQSRFRCKLKNTGLPCLTSMVSNSPSPYWNPRSEIAMLFFFYRWPESSVNTVSLCLHVWIDLLITLKNQRTIRATKAKGIRDSNINFHISSSIRYIIQVTFRILFIQINRWRSNLLFDG